MDKAPSLGKIPRGVGDCGTIKERYIVACQRGVDMTDGTYNILIYLIKRAMEKDRVNTIRLQKVLEEVVLLKHLPDVS